MTDNNFKELQQDVQAKTAIVEIVKSEIVDTKFRDIAEIKSKLDAYKLVCGNYESFIKTEAEKLANPNERLDWTVHKELGIARLIAAWLVETEKFLEEHESTLHGAEKDIRKDFVKESLAALPEDIREDVMNRAREKRHEFMAWLETELKIAFRKARERSVD